jgi:hypothetical protein
MYCKCGNKITSYNTEFLDYCVECNKEIQSMLRDIMPSEDTNETPTKNK